MGIETLVSEKERDELLLACQKPLSDYEVKLTLCIVWAAESWIIKASTIDDYGSSAAALRHFIDDGLDNDEFIRRVWDELDYDPDLEDEALEASQIKALDASTDYLEALYKKLSTASELLLSIKGCDDHFEDYLDENEESGVGYTEYQEVSIRFKNKTYVVFYEDDWVNPHAAGDETIALAHAMQDHDGGLEEYEDYDEEVYIKKICAFLSESDI